MSAGKVISYPRIPTYANVLAGQPVMGIDAENAAATAMWAMGRGGTLIPTCVMKQTFTPGQTKNFRTRVYTRNQSAMRMWTLSMRAVTSGGNNGLVKVIITPGGGSAQTFWVPLREDAAYPISCFEEVASASDADEELIITVESDGDNVNSFLLVALGCTDVPRRTLEQDATDVGVDLTTTQFRAPIFDDTGESLGGVLATTQQSFTAARRLGMYHFIKPDNVTDATQVTATSFTPLFRGNVSMLGRKYYTSSTTTTLDWMLLAASKAGNSGTASIRITMTSGATSTINVLAATTTISWHGTPNTFAVDCEDLSVGDGRRSSRWDEMLIEGKVNGGGDVLYVCSIAVREPPP